MSKYSIFLLTIMAPTAVLAAPLTITSKVASVSYTIRPGVDHIGIQVLLKNPITGTSCAPADVARGFYMSSGVSIQGVEAVKAYANMMFIAQAQDLPVTFTYDSLTGCASGYGISWPATPVTLASPQ